MSWQAWLTLAVVVMVVIILARDIVAPAMVVFAAAVALLVAGILTPAEAFAGFSNPAPITVAALYVVARAVEKTGGLQPIIAATLGGGHGERRTLARLLFPAAAVSAFLNNTPIVAMLVGPITEWAEKNSKSPSRYLMPLSYAVLLGGVVTAIGTSTNLVVSGLLQQHGQPPLGLFELTPIGLPVMVVGVLVIILLAPIVLPDRRAPRAMLESGVREFAVHMVVSRGGPLEGRAVEAGGLRHLQGVYLVQIERDREIIAPVDPKTVLRGGDRLTFVGRADLVRDLQMMRGLESAERQHIAAFDTERHTFFLVVLGAESALVGKTLKEVDFRSRYQAAVVALHRAGHRVAEKLGQVELRVGDTLMVLADRGFFDRWRDRSDFLVVSRIGGSAPAMTRKAPIAALVMILVVIVAGTGLLPILQSAVLGAFALVLLRVLTPAEARGAVNLDVILLIASSFALGTALEKTGLAGSLAHILVGSFAWIGKSGALLGVALATMAVNEVITNNAAAALLFPIGLSAAAQVNASPRAFAIAVAIAASASFLTPIGYQTNTMVYGPGGYRFSDYARLGLPLTIIVAIVITTLIPWLWS